MYSKRGPESDASESDAIPGAVTFAARDASALSVELPLTARDLRAILYAFFKRCLSCCPRRAGSQQSLLRQSLPR